MIRKLRASDINRVMSIWLQENIRAHSFVDDTDWKAHYADVKKAMLVANVYIYQEQNTIKGFAEIQDDYLAGIFVFKEFQGQGVGHALMKHIKQQFSAFQRDVYVLNKPAIRFYLREGLRIIKSGVDSETGKPEYRMQWK